MLLRRMAARAGPRMATSVPQCTPRHFSSDPDEQTMWGKVKGQLGDRMTGRQVKKQGEMFEAMMDQFTVNKNYNIMAFLDFNRMLLKNSGADGWKSKLPWQNEQEKQGIEDIKKTITALESIPQHLKLRKKLKGAEARLVAEQIPMDYEEFRQIMHKLTMSQSMAKWVKYRKRSGKPMPTSQEEMNFLMYENALRMSKRELYKASWDSLKTRYE